MKELPLLQRSFFCSCSLQFVRFKAFKQKFCFYSAAYILTNRLTKTLAEGAFHSIKNSGLKFRKFHLANGTVNPELFRLVIPAPLDRTNPFSVGRTFPEMYYREALETEIVSNGTVISKFSCCSDFPDNFASILQIRKFYSGKLRN